MAVDLKQLELLKGEMPYKWREQSVNARGATMVAYIDARQLFDKLDEVCGVGNWQSDFRLVDGKLYGGIGISVENIGRTGRLDVGILGGRVPRGIRFRGAFPCSLPRSSGAYFVGCGDAFIDPDPDTRLTSAPGRGFPILHFTSVS